jgi:beta-glucosidase
VAEILFGDRDPSGKLPVSVPRHAGQLPVSYDQPPSKAHWLKDGWGSRYADLEPTPLFPFGHGLTYTSFELSSLRLSAPAVPRDGTLEVTFDLQNTGKRAGTETVQLYVRDLQSSATTPVQRLRGWKRVTLAPGESTAVTLPLPTKDLALVSAAMRRVIEPGEFEVMVGTSSADIRLRERFAVR